jgi:hypothetical protein
MCSSSIAVSHLWHRAMHSRTVGDGLLVPRRTPRDTSIDVSHRSLKRTGISGSDTTSAKTSGSTRPPRWTRDDRNINQSSRLECTRAPSWRSRFRSRPRPRRSPAGPPRLPASPAPSLRPQRDA